MPLQYLQDNNGATTAVLIPIDEWRRITEKYSDIEQLPQWQKNLIDERLMHLQQNPESVIPLKDFIKEVDQEDESI